MRGVSNCKPLPLWHSKSKLRLHSFIHGAQLGVEGRRQVSRINEHEKGFLPHPGAAVVPRREMIVWFRKLVKYTRNKRDGRNLVQLDAENGPKNEPRFAGGPVAESVTATPGFRLPFESVGWP